MSGKNGGQAESAGWNGCNTYPIQSTFRLLIRICRKRPLSYRSDIFPQMLRIECTHNGGMHIRMSEREAQEEGGADSSWLAQFI